MRLLARSTATPSSGGSRRGGCPRRKRRGRCPAGPRTKRQAGPRLWPTTARRRAQRRVPRKPCERRSRSLRASARRVAAPPPRPAVRGRRPQPPRPRRRRGSSARTHWALESRPLTARRGLRPCRPRVPQRPVRRRRGRPSAAPPRPRRPDYSSLNRPWHTSGPIEVPHRVGASARCALEFRVVRAVVFDRYGGPDVLHIEDVEKPLPRDDEVLVRIYAVAVTRADCATRQANRNSGRGFELVSRAVFGLRRPRQPILGGDFSGVVEAVGPAVKEFATGDEVFGSTGFRFGAYAEYISRRASSRITRMPQHLSRVEAAGITDGGLYALSPLRAANVKNGDSVLVYGASGAIGTAGVQLAKYFGAHVTAVTSTKNLELVKSLGADDGIDYTKEDFTENGQSYDVIFDAVGKHSFVRSRNSLKPGGRFLPTDGFDNLLRVLTTRCQDKKVIFPTGAVTKK